MMLLPASSFEAFTDPKPLTDSKAGIVLAGLSAAVPAAMIGGFMGASAASYDAKQRDWAMKGAAAAGAFAISMFVLNMVRKRESQHASGLPGLGP